MKTIAILAIIGIAATAFFAFSSSTDSVAESQFRDFLATYRVGYGTTEEYSYRLGVFQDNLKRIDELNRANPTATFAVNQFGDRTPEEMSRLMTLTAPRVSGRHTFNGKVPDVDHRAMWDTVKNQAQCGSCWAFSATAAVEARYAAAQGQKKITTLFSEQQLVDCDPQSSGCNGGWMDYAFTYLETHPFCTEAEYAYTGKTGTCHDSACAGTKVKSFVDITAKDEDALLAALVDAPVSVAVDASTWSFYAGGILSKCGTGLNHGVTLVAANANDNSVTIRNSWGPSWGEKGYIRLAAGQDTCGYANVASYPTF